MKKLLFTLVIALSSILTFAQTSLEGIVVERVPVTAAAVSADPALTASHVAYRVYADVAAGWELQAVFALATHESRISSSTEFYNNGLIGGFAYGRSVSTALFNNAAGKFDSWITIGAVTSSRVGVLQIEDTDGTIDGFMNATTESLGTSNSAYDVWADVNVVGTFSTFSGIVSQNAGEEGRTSTNRVLIGQFTTDGTFSFDLNLQTRRVGTSTTERFVASTPQAGEFLFNGLSYTATSVPTVSLVAPTSGASIAAGSPFTLSANATDGNGIAKVEFYYRGVKLGEDADVAGGWTYNWTPVGADAGTGVVTALAIDTEGDIAWASNSITVTATIPSFTNVLPAGPNVKRNVPFAVSADVTDAGGTVTSVRIYVGGAEVTPVTKTGDTYSIVNQSAGTLGALAIRFDAIDNDGNPASFTRNVTVVNNVAPTVALTAPANGAIVTEGSSVTVSATADDTDGDVASVQFYAGATPIGSPVLAEPYTVTWTAAGSGSVALTAVATDDNGAPTTSAARTVTVASSSTAYVIANQSALCYASDAFCMPILSNKTVSDVLGYDFIIKYDPAKVRPSGVISVSNELLSAGVTYNMVNAYVNISSGQMNVSLAFNASAPGSARFEGVSGERLICIEFVKTTAFTATDVVTFEIDEMIESKVSGSLPVVVADGTFTSTVDVDFKGILTFWKDDAAIVNDGTNNLPVYIYPAANTTQRLTPASVNNNLGEFTTQIGAGGVNKYLKIVRNIAPATSVQPIVNGADAQMVAKMIVNDASFRPNIYQVLAMDVNRDGSVTSGDLTQIMQRSVLHYDEFKQTNNYNDNGTFISGSGISKDWLWITQDTLVDAQYRISATFPQNDLTGYSKYKVPVADTVQQIRIDGETCQLVTDKSFQGIMLGDVNGSYSTAASSPTLKSTQNSAVVFDLANAKFVDGYVDVPVYFSSASDVTSMDFALQLNEDNVSFGSTMKNVSGLESADYFNLDDRTLRFTSYSLQNLEAGRNLVTLRFATSGKQMKSSDLSVAFASLNGDAVAAKITEANVITGDVDINVYPNPASDMLNIEVSVAAKVLLMDMSGKSVMLESKTEAAEKHQMNISGIAEGIYMLKVYNEEFVSVKKVVIKR